MELTRDAAWALVTEWTQSESLRKHMLAVEAAVRGYARHFGEDEEAWSVVALLHDFDYERFPDAEHHPFEGVAVLKGLGYPEWVTRAILSHADYSGVARESRLEKTLYACDEMSGFVTAAALVRPSKSVLDLEASSVMKRMKDKAFAQGGQPRRPAAGRRGARDCRSRSTSPTSSDSCANAPRRWACRGMRLRPAIEKRITRASCKVPFVASCHRVIVIVAGDARTRRASRV